MYGPYRLPLLYNLELDPNECYNVINTYPDIGEKLHKKMVEWEKRVQRNPRGLM